MIKEARIVSVVSLFPLPQYVVVLEDLEKTRLVPIWIGMNEGNAIALELQGEKFPRPLTHDLIVMLLSTLGAAVEKVVVSDLKENSYYALIYLKSHEKVLTIDARPSDSLAIAVRIHCPVYIDEKVLKKCPAVDKPITEKEIDKFKGQLKNTTPEDFFKQLEESSGAEEPPAGKDKQGEGDEDNDDDENEGEDDEKKFL